MTPLAMMFMGLTWTLVLGITFWSYSRVLRAQRAPGSAADASGDSLPAGGLHGPDPG